MATYRPTLALDKTGKHPDNLIQDEEHVLPVGMKRLVLLRHGAFFKESLKIVDQKTHKTLQSSQYEVLDIYQSAVVQTGLEVYNVIVIYDEQVQGPLLVTYQALGGPYSFHKEQLLNWFNEHQKQTRSEQWALIEDKPLRYQAKEHKQHSRDLFGAEYITKSLERFKESILNQNDVTYQRFLEQLETKLQDIKEKAHQQVTRQISERYNQSFQWSGKASIGLSQVENYKTLDLKTAKALALPNFSPEDIKEEKYVTLRSLSQFSDILEDKLLQTTQTQIGLKDLVYKDPTRASLLSSRNGEIFAFYSKKHVLQEEIDHDTEVYPEDIALDEPLSIIKISANNTHYGGVWLAIGLNSLQVYLGHLANDMCFTPMRWYRLLKDGDLNQVKQLIQEHIQDTKNPHRLTKEQVGLSKLENLPVVTEEDILNEEGVYKYLTLDTLIYYTMKFLMGKPLPKGPDGKPDPNRRPMDQDAIIFTTCKKCLDDPKHPSKGMLVKTWCDGSDRFARYTDGNGGYEDKVLQLDSNDCKSFKIPDAGTVLAVYCNEHNKMSTVSDGHQGVKEIITEINSKDCGYQAPQEKGTVIAEYCEGLNEMRRYADGTGGEFDMVVAVNSPRCGAIVAAPKSGPIRQTCQGTTKVLVYADGNGGEREEHIPNSPDCQGGHQPGGDNGSGDGGFGPHPGGGNGAIHAGSSQTNVLVSQRETLYANLSGFTPNTRVPIAAYVSTPTLQNGRAVVILNGTVQIDGSGNGRYEYAQEIKPNIFTFANTNADRVTFDTWFETPGGIQSNRFKRTIHKAPEGGVGTMPHPNDNTIHPGSRDIPHHLDFKGSAFKHAPSASTISIQANGTVEVDFVTSIVQSYSKDRTEATLGLSSGEVVRMRTNRVETQNGRTVMHFTANRAMTMKEYSSVTRVVLQFTVPRQPGGGIIYDFDYTNDFGS